MGAFDAITFPAGRSRGLTAAATGIAGALWLGWAGTSIPTAWLAPLGAGILLACGVGVAGVSVAVVAARTPHPIRAGWRYWAATGVEAAGMVAGAAVLAALDDRRWVPLWVAAIVAVHLVPTAVALGHRCFLVLSGLVVAAIAAGLAAHFAAGMSPGAVSSGGVGVALLAFGSLTLVSGRLGGRTRIRVTRRSEANGSGAGRPPVG